MAFIVLDPFRDTIGKSTILFITGNHLKRCDAVAISDGLLCSLYSLAGWRTHSLTLSDLSLTLPISLSQLSPSSLSAPSTRSLHLKPSHICLTVHPLEFWSVSLEASFPIFRFGNMIVTLTA